MDGSFSYRHDGSETTADSFSYFLSDGNGGTADGTVSINILPSNDRPEATDDIFVVAEAGVLDVAAPGILANDFDADGDTLTARQLTGPTNGTLTLNSDGSFIYTHDGGESKTDTFTYASSDGSSTDTATVSINIDPVNDAPIVARRFIFSERGWYIEASQPQVSCPMTLTRMATH